MKFQKYGVIILVVILALFSFAMDALAIGKPDIYAESIDDLSIYGADKEKVTVYDNGEKKKVSVNLLPIDDVQMLVWQPVDGVNWYKVSVRDVDSDTVVFNEDKQSTDRYWFDTTILDMETNYKIAVGAYVDADNYAWGEYYYFRLIDSVVETESYDYGEYDDESGYDTGIDTGYGYVDDSWENIEDEAKSEDAPRHSSETDLPKKQEEKWDDDPYVEQNVTTFSGYFGYDTITINVGDRVLLQGEVNSYGSSLSRVTYQIDGWFGDDENNRYRSQVVSGMNFVELSSLSELVIDASSAPLNVPGSYTLTLVASAEDGTWEQLDQMTIVVIEGAEEKKEEPNHSSDPEDEPASAPAFNRGADDEPANPQHSIEFNGYFKENSIKLNVGESAYLEGAVGVIGGKLARVTYQIDGWMGDDENNRYCSQEVNNADSVNLSTMSELVLDASSAPLNVPGEYTLTLVASATDGTWKQLDTMTVIVEENVNRQPSFNATPEPKGKPQPTAEETDTVEISGYFREDLIKLNIGESVYLEGAVGVIGGKLARVTYQIDGWMGDDENNRYCTQEVNNANSVNLSTMSELVLDASAAPLNVPGSYTLTLVASAADGTWRQLDQITVNTSDGAAVSTEPDVEPAHEPIVTAAPDFEEVTEEDAVESQLTAEINGYFKEDSVKLNVGESVYLEGEIGIIGGKLARVTYQIDGWMGDDENNRYCTQEVNDADYVNLSNMSELVLDASSAPLNVPGSYTLMLVASAADGTWKQLDTMTVIVSGESSFSDDPSSNIAVNHCLGSFSHSTKTLSIGEKWIVEGTVKISANTLGKVTVNAAYHDDSMMTEDFSAHHTASINLQDWAMYTIDTNKAPWNVPGTYELRIWAKDAAGEGGDMPLATMTLNIVEAGIGILPNSIFIKQNEGKTCTLASAVMMMRARAYLEGCDEWSTITESSTKSTAWLTGSGLYNSYTYAFSGNSISVGSEILQNGISPSALKELLDQHREGIVLYVYDKPHAVLITDYVGDTFYCADPAGSYSGKRIALADSFMADYYGCSQDQLLLKADKYWIVTSYTIISGTGGEEGQLIKELQNLLIQHGYDVGNSGTDGIWGKNTRNAMNRFRAEVMHLDAIDYVDDATMQALRSGGSRDTQTGTDWNTPFTTVKSTGQQDPSKGFLINSNLLGKVLYVKDEVGGWFRLIAPADGDYYFSVYAPNLDRDSFTISLRKGNSDAVYTDLHFKKTNTVQTQIVRNVRKGEVLYWWNYDDTPRYWTLQSPFEMMISVEKPSASTSEMNSGNCSHEWGEAYYKNAHPHAKVYPCKKCGYLYETGDVRFFENCCDCVGHLYDGDDYSCCLRCGKTAEQVEADMVEQNPEYGYYVPCEHMTEVKYSEHPHIRAYFECTTEGCPKYGIKIELDDQFRPYGRELSWCDECFPQQQLSNDHLQAMADVTETAYDTYQLVNDYLNGKTVDGVSVTKTGHKGVYSVYGDLQLGYGKNDAQDYDRTVALSGLRFTEESGFADSYINVTNTADGELVLTISFEGTQASFKRGFADAFTDANTHMNSDGIHSGFAKIAIDYMDGVFNGDFSIKCGIDGVERDYRLSEIMGMIQDDPNAHIRITGHSMGGAAAQCLAYYLIRGDLYEIPKEKVEVITFASPIPFSYDALESIIFRGVNVYNFINVNDIVPDIGVSISDGIITRIAEEGGAVASNAAFDKDSNGGMSIAGTNLGTNIYVSSDDLLVWNAKGAFKDHDMLMTYEKLVEGYTDGSIPAYVFDTDILFSEYYDLSEHKTIKNIVDIGEDIVNALKISK